MTYVSRHFSWTEEPALEMLAFNNVAEVERKESLFSLPKFSSVSKKPHTAERGVATEGSNPRVPLCGVRREHRDGVSAAAPVMKKEYCSKAWTSGTLGN